MNKIQLLLIAGLTMVATNSFAQQGNGANATTTAPITTTNTATQITATKNTQPLKIENTNILSPAGQQATREQEVLSRTKLKDNKNAVEPAKANTVPQQRVISSDAPRTNK